MPTYEVEPVDDATSSDSWFAVRHASLHHDLEVQIRLDKLGRAHLVGLRIDGGRPVTGRHLREIRPREVAEAVVGWVRETSADFWDTSKKLADGVGDRFSGVPPMQIQNMALEGWDDRAEDLVLSWEYGANALALDRYLEAVAGASADDEAELKSRGRGARAPSDADYRAFARAWLECAQESEYRLMPRLARRLGMSRPTAYRWATEARERGLIPPKGDAS